MPIQVTKLKTATTKGVQYLFRERSKCDGT